MLYSHLLFYCFFFSGWVLKWIRGLCWCLMAICFANGWILRLNVGADRMFCHTTQIKLLLIQTNPFVNCRTRCSDGSHVNYLYKCGEFHVKSTNQMYNQLTCITVSSKYAKQWFSNESNKTMSPHMWQPVESTIDIKKKSATKLIWLCSLMWSLVHAYFTFRA